MKKVISKVLAFIIAFTMVVTLIPAMPASAAITGIEISLQSSPGEFTVSMGSETWTTRGCSCEGGVEGKTVKSTAYTALEAPERFGKTFQGWAVYEYRGSGQWHKVSTTYLTSEQVLNYTVPNCAVMFKAKWNGEALPNVLGNTVGYEGGIQGNGGEFDVTCNGETWRTGGCSRGGFDEGASLRDMGYTKVENATHPEGLYLQGWYPYVAEGVLTSSNWKKISGAELLSTSEMLDYKITGQSIFFFAQWGTDKSENDDGGNNPTEPNTPVTPEEPSEPNDPTDPGTPSEPEQPLTECEKNGHKYKVLSTKKATTSKNGSIKQKCSVCGETDIATLYKISSVKCSTAKYTYNGSVKKPSVTVKDSKGNTISSKYYTVSYAKGRKAVGRYKVTVKFKTRYSGTKTAYFTIVPKAPSSASATLYGYDDVKFSWKKSTGAKGYSVYYKTATGSYKLLTRTTKTSVKKANLSDGIKYTFKVVPYYKSGSTRYDALTSKTASVYTLKKMAAPTVEKYNNSKVKVKWTDIDGQSGYQISKSTSKTKTSIVSTYATTSGQSKVISTAKNKTYYYKVRAYKTVGKTKIYGPWSAVKAYKLSNKVETVKINITMDNVDEYFEIKEVVYWYENAFGEAEEVSWIYKICLKDEYVSRLKETYYVDDETKVTDSYIIFECEWENREFDTTVDFDKKTYEAKESTNPAWEEEDTSIIEECYGTFDKYYGDHWAAGTGWNSIFCSVDREYGTFETITRQVNHRFTRASGTLILIK